MHPRPERIRGEYVALHPEHGDWALRLDVLQHTPGGLVFAWARLPSWSQQLAACDACPGQTHNAARYPECGTHRQLLSANKIVLRENPEVTFIADVQVVAEYAPRPDGSVMALVYAPRNRRLAMNADELLTAKCFADYCSQAAK